MSLRIIFGRAGSGKTRFCLNEIKSRIASGETNPLILLVPEQFTFQAERELISVLETGGILKTEVLSFRRLAFRVFNEAGGITYPHIHSAGKCMILYRILDRLKDDLQVFSRSAERQGFVNSLSALITEFKRYNVTPETLESTVMYIEEGNPLRIKLRELATIYALFEETLAKRYRDTDDDLTLAAEKLDFTSIYDHAEIWIDGFDGFTPQEYKLIGKLLRKARRVNVSLCTDCLEDGEDGFKGIDIFSTVKRAYKKLIKIAAENDVPVESPVFLNKEPLYRFEKNPELSHLEKYLYAYPYKVYKEKTGNISLFYSANVFSEIEACARDIVRLCREKGLRFRDVGVIAGNLAEYESLVEVIFEEYGIPCFIDRKVEIANHPLVCLILSMLDIFNENWSYEAVFRYLKTGLTGIPQEDIDLLENYVLACGIKGNRWLEDEWKVVPGLIPDESDMERYSGLLERVNSIKNQVRTPLLEFRDKTKGRKKASEFCESLYNFLCSLGVPERIEERIETFKNDGNLNLANEYSQVWNIVMEVFDQMVEVMGDETFGIERFANILAVGLGEYKIGLIPASLDKVVVGSVDRTRSHEIKALYILGANDGIFPPPAAEEGILSDMDRTMLDGLGIELASDTRTQAFDGQYLVYRALTTPKDFLRISWPIADNEGRALRPSMIISRIRKLFPAITETSDILPPSTQQEEIELISCRNSAFKHMVTALRRKADGKDIAPLWQGVYRWFASQEDWTEKCLAAKAAFQYKNLAQRVSREKVALLYGNPAVSSVSRLEKFTSCPFSFYVQYGLGAKERKVYRLSPPDVGTFMHAVVERFSRLVSEGDISWRDFDYDWCSAKVSEIIDEMLEKMQGSGIAASKRYTTLTLRLKRVVTRAVWLIAQHIRRSSFEPVEYEVGFGEGEKYPPIVIELDSGQKILLEGRIDRVDAFKAENGTYLRIIDYKSGSKDFRLSDVYYGLQIQLITYMDAIWRSGVLPGSEEKDRSVEKMQNTEMSAEKEMLSESSGKSEETSPYLPAGILYFKIDDPIVRGNGKITEEEVEKAIMRQLKMRGLLLADVKLIKEMDKTIEGTSLIIPAAVNKGDVLGKNTSAATMEQFELLRKYIRKLLKNLCSEIMEGNVEIRPYKKKGTTSCKYCSFLPVCQFDATMKENSYRLLYDRNNDEVWELMRKEQEN